VTEQPQAASAVYRAPHDWARLHPISPLLGGWAVFAAVFTVWAYNFIPEWAGGSGGQLDEVVDELGLDRQILLVVLGILLIVATVIGLGYLSWWKNQFRLGEDALHQRKGILWRQQRQARLDRLQAVDIVQPLLARIFGFAAVSVQVAGGENSGIKLEYLRLGDAEALRNEVLARAAGYKAVKAQAAGEAPATLSDEERAALAASPAAPSLRDVIAGAEATLRGATATATEFEAAPEREVYRVNPGRLIGSILLGPVLDLAVLVLVLLTGIVTAAFVASDREVAAVLGAVFGSAAALLPLVFGVAAVVWGTVNRGWGFVAGLSPDGIRLRHGLLEKRRQTVPPGRVQAVEFKQTLLWRPFDWWQVTINVAGYQDEGEAVSTLLPVGTRADALTALWLVLPDLGDPDPGGTISHALSGKGNDGGFTPSPTRSWVFDALQWRQRGVRATDNALLIRSGWLVRTLSVTPHERTQSLGLKQGPLQRLLKLADVHVHSTKGPVRPRACHLDVADAMALLEAQSDRATEGRKRQTPEQWMASVGLLDTPAAPADVLGADDSPGTKVLQ
jgi:putative membrane protein